MSLYSQEAMEAKQPAEFGDKNTADVRLNLIDSAGVEYPGNPLLLHSQVLKKAEFFETKLSQSGSSPKLPFEMKVTCSGHPESYIKCIQLMYSYDTDQCFNFTNVDDALAILQVASEVMFRDCMESCMRYLDAMGWNRDQEAKLRVLLSSLNITVLPDLAARLGMTGSESDCKDIRIVTESVQDWLQMTYRNKKYCSTVEQGIANYFKLNMSPAIKDACRDAILNRFKEDVEAIKSNKSDQSSIITASGDLSWLVGVIRHCDAKLFATVVKEFCEDPDLRNAVAATRDYFAACDMVTMVNGEIITSMSLRVDFLINWTDTMVKLVNNKYNILVDNNLNREFQKSLEKGIIGVGETLPLVEQKRIYSVCQDVFTKNSVDMNRLFKWWAQKLEDAIILHKI